MTADLRADIEARELSERLTKLAADIIRGGKDNIWRARVALRGYNDLIAAAAVLAARPTVESAGVDLIAAERRRQVEVEGYNPGHDAGHATELAMAAACYAIPTLSGRGLWPWAPSYWRPTPGDRVRELVKAGALIAAAIDAASSERAGVDR